MNTTELKAYAPKARTNFINAVSAQAARFGVTAKKVEPAKVEGDVLLVAGQAFPARLAEPLKKLIARVEAHGFDATMEAIAYTWFNRLVAIRYMELHGYLDHGYRVLSHPEGQGRPEILDHAADVDLPGLDRSKVVELKLDGKKDEALYRLLLLAQCNALNKAMPFLFDRIGNETELLLPSGLLQTDSLIRQLVEGVDESAWQQIEIIGWLYQFYISEKKDEVIGKVVKSEDIPAATQLFTPNWIVKYMVHNSLGAQWLATYPNSPLKAQMEYYIEPAEQTDEVRAQLAAITPAALNPEELTLIDPACGSGHILVEAYDIFKAIYLERGYRQRDVPKLIIEKNLFGLDIDQRAAQLAGFSLMMKGRADDRRFFERDVTLNVMALVDSVGFDPQPLIRHSRESGNPGDATLDSDLHELKQLFEHATTFGSLIQIPEELAEKLPPLRELANWQPRKETTVDWELDIALKRLKPLVRQAELLAAQYDAVVANPPYMGSKGMNALVKKFAKDNFPDAKSDLFACFIERGFSLAHEHGFNAMVTMQSWMFLSSFQKMRERLLREKTITTMAHLGARAFGSISGEVVQATTMVLRNCPPTRYRPVFFRLLDGGEQEKQAALCSGENRFDTTAQDEFKKIPGSPVAYWVSERVRKVFSVARSLDAESPVRQGMATTDNKRFLRLWPEVALSNIGFALESREAAVESRMKWFPYNKGGEFRKWFGNLAFVVNYGNDGGELKEVVKAKYREKDYAQGFTDEKWDKLIEVWVLKNQHSYFLPSVTWSFVSSSYFGVRHCPAGFIFDVGGSSTFPRAEHHYSILALLVSKISAVFMGALNPTLNFQVENVSAIPILDHALEICHVPSVKALVALCENDWNAYERSWDFQSLPFLSVSSDPRLTLESSYTAWITQSRDTTAEMKRLEEENNRLFIEAYGLQDELAPDVPIEQITLTVNPAYRYGGKVGVEEQWTRFRQDTMQELVSYAIGCMMGRYSLDEPGLIYANSGNEGFDHSKYTKFPADDDGIVPLTDTEWFDDDACHRLVEFISVAWPSENNAHLEENLTFLADNLSPKKNEPARDTIRRYLNDKFFKDHLKTYKKRPIYWLFASGKQKAFQCLVYLHRYNEGTLSRMRSEYVIPLQGKMAARLEKLKDDIDVESSTAHRKRLEKERDKLGKQQVELLAFDEKLRHFADKRIALDLDDGVKVNYGKFGDLLAEVKAAHGKKPEGV